jgi:hypothetical protein
MLEWTELVLDSTVTGSLLALRNIPFNSSCTMIGMCQHVVFDYVSANQIIFILMYKAFL